MRKIVFIGVMMVFCSCSESTENNHKTAEASIEPKRLKIEEAKQLIHLPFSCVDIEYPNKLNQVIAGAEDLSSPADLHPSFYGCFDWHSAVHGHWSLVRMAKLFPELNKSDSIVDKLLVHLSEENISGELEYFKNETNKSFERMYGWAWLLKLTAELHSWDHPKAKMLEKNIRPLSELIAMKTIDFLPKLKYAIRVGTHTNTAFALSLAHDFATTFDNVQLQNEIEKTARRFYSKDNGCPIEWEPSGYDFLSPCLEEANLMRKILGKDEFRKWLGAFLPSLLEPDYKLEPGIVSDRKDGHLVHLDGLNFSRAWCLYGIAKTLPECNHLVEIANKHVTYSLPNLVGDDYEGGHWLASFALLAIGN